MNMPQQQNRAQPRVGGKQQQTRQNEDYYGYLIEQPVEITLHNGQQVKGVLNKVSRFQIGLLVNGEQVYVNKGFIVTIKPLQLPGQPGSNVKRGDGQNGGRGF